MPSGKVAQPSITDNKDGTVTVRYSPSEAGLHEMDIRYDNMHIPGGCIASCPFHPRPTLLSSQEKQAGVGYRSVSRLLA